MSLRNRHHRWPRSRKGPSNSWNCCRVDAKRHTLWHALFGNMNGFEIMQEVNNSLLDPRFELIVKPRKDR